MSRMTLKRLAVLGALSLGGLAQTASAQWMPFGGGFGGGCGGCEMPQMPATVCGPMCAPPPPVACAPPQPQFVMQPFTENRTVEQVVQRPVYETKYVEVPETQYRQEYETRVAQVPTMSYQNVTEMQTRQRDCGRWVTNYRCRPQVAACAYDCRPGLFGMMNRSLYQARMSMTPAVIAERNYVPNVITEQIPVTRQVAVPGVRQVTYQIPKTVAFTTRRQVAVQSTRYVAEKVQQQVQVTTMRMVQVNPTGTGMAYGYPGTIGTANLPGYFPSGTAAVPDPLFNPTRTATRIDPVTPSAAPIPARTTRPRSSLIEGAADEMTPAAPVNKSGAGRVIPPRDPAADIVEEVAQTSGVIRHTAAYRPAPQVETVTSLPSIVRVSQWNGYRNTAAQPAAQVSVASSGQTRK